MKKQEYIHYYANGYKMKEAYYNTLVKSHFSKNNTIYDKDGMVVAFRIKNNEGGKEWMN